MVPFDFLFGIHGNAQEGMSKSCQREFTCLVNTSGLILIIQTNIVIPASRLLLR